MKNHLPTLSLLSKDTIHLALKSYASVKNLSKNRLAGLAIVERERQAKEYSDTAIGRGLALQEVVEAAIESTKPSADPASTGEKPWRPYQILKEHFVRQKTVEQVVMQLHVSRQTYFNEQNRALELLVDILSRWENTCRQEPVGRASLLRQPAPFLAPPRPAHGLVGRQSLLADLKARLLAGRTVAISALQGLPGVGKTALAIELAHDRDVLAHFPDGVLWAGLGRQADVIAQLGMWATALGIPLGEIVRHRRVEERARMIYTAIGMRRMLLIIDDAWHTQDALAFRLGGPNCAHLMTTRLASIALDFAGTEMLTVPELEPSSGLVLLERLAPHAVHSNREEAEELVRRVGGLPLAILLMGQHLHRQSYRHQHQRLRDALAELHTAERRLQLTASRSPVEQHPSLLPGQRLSLQTVIGVSDAALEAAERQALRALSVFPPKPATFSEAAALAVIAAPRDLLDRLVDDGLVECLESGRYTLHQAISDYARLDSPHQTARKRFVDYFLHLTEQNVGNDESLTAELNNILAGLAWTVEYSWHDKLLAWMCAFHSYLLKHGLYQVAEPYLNKALDVLDEGELEKRYTLLAAREKVSEILGKHDAQRADLAALKRLTKRSNQKCLQAEVALRQSIYNEAISNFLASAKAAQQAIKLAQACADRQKEAVGYLQWGQALVRLGDYPGAQTQLRLALALFQECQCPALEVSSLAALSSIAMFEGNYAQVRRVLERASQLYHEIEDWRGESKALLNVGVIENLQGDFENASFHFEHARYLFRKLGDRKGEGMVLSNLATSAFQQGAFELAHAYLQECLKAGREIGNRLTEAICLSNMGIVYRHLGLYTDARTWFEMGLDVCKAINHRPGIAANYSLQSYLSHLVGDHATAHGLALESLSMARDLPDVRVQAYALTNLGRALAAQQKWAEAEQAYQEAISLRRNLNQRALCIETIAALAHVYLAQGNLERAQKCVAEICRYLQHKNLDGVDEPLDVYWTAYQVLLARHDTFAAWHILKDGYAYLQQRSTQIDNPDWQHSYHENVSVNREVIACWKKVSGGPSSI